MKKIIAIFLSVWTTVSVFSSNDFTPPDPQPEPEYIYKFEPDAESPGAEVAPLEVNKKDEDVPNQLPSSSEQTMPQKQQEPILLPILPVFSLPAEQ